MLVANVDEMLRALRVLAEPDDVVELRALNVVNGYREETRSGYFTDFDELVRHAASFSSRASGVYITLQQLKHAVIARSENKMRKALKDRGVSTDNDVALYRWLPIDLDPVRPSGISSSDAEHHFAALRARAVCHTLRLAGWPDPVIADSGNGYHVLYPISLPNTRETVELVEAVLRAVASQFNDERVAVDISLFNPGRILKLYGTLARKGESTIERPHRLSRLLHAPAQMVPVSRELLEQMVAEVLFAETARKYAQRRKPEIDVPGWLSAHGLEVASRPEVYNGGLRWKLAQCPFNPEHKAPAVFQGADGVLGFHCLHKSCGGNDWSALRRLVESVSNNRETITASPSEEPLEIVPPVEPALPMFPAHVLPQPARRLVWEAAHALGCPPDLIAVPMLAALGAAIGTRWCIELKPGWRECACIYAAVVQPPGSAKSPAQQFATAPLYKIQNRHHEADVLIASAATSSGRPTQRGKPEGNTKESEKRQKETYWTLISTDATTEALALVLRDNPHGVLYDQDELTALIGSFDKYRRGNGSDRQFFQSVWSCRSLEIDRVKTGKMGRLLDSIRVEVPFIAIVGGIQPDMIQALSDDRGRDDGFIDRFLFSYPNNSGLPYTDDGVSEEAMEGYQSLIERLFFQPIAFSRRKVPVAPLTPEGAEMWSNFMSEHRAEMDREDFPAYLRGPWRKLATYCARFALIIQQSRRAIDETETLEVNADSVAAAVTLVQYFKAHTRKVYHALRQEPGSERATTLLEWIASRGGKASVRDVLTAKVADCKTKGDVMLLFERLRSNGAGWIGTTKPEGGGRATIYFDCGRRDC
jgi:hypothetical protein